VTMLEEMGVETKNEDGKKIPRNVLRKRIVQKIQEDTPQTYFEGLNSKVVEKVVTQLLGDDKPSNSKKYVEKIVSTIDEMGLENALSSLTLEELQQLAKLHKLKVHSATSINAYIEALVSGEDQEKPQKKERKQEKPSKDKPKIKKGISKVDLRQHYYRDELVAYCKENDLPTSGHVTEVINRIMDHLDGKPVKAKPAGKKRKGATSKEKPAKKAKTEKSKPKKEDKSEKSDKEDEEEGDEQSEKSDDKEDKAEGEKSDEDKDKTEKSEKAEKSEKDTEKSEKSEGKKADKSDKSEKSEKDTEKSEKSEGKKSKGKST